MPRSHARPTLHTLPVTSSAQPAPRHSARTWTLLSICAFLLSAVSLYWALDAHEHTEDALRCSSNEALRKASCQIQVGLVGAPQFVSSCSAVIVSDDTALSAAHCNDPGTSAFYVPNTTVGMDVGALVYSTNEDIGAPLPLWQAERCTTLTVPSRGVYVGWYGYWRQTAASLGGLFANITSVRVDGVEALSSARVSVPRYIDFTTVWGWDGATLYTTGEQGSDVQASSDIARILFHSNVSAPAGAQLCVTSSGARAQPPSVLNFGTADDPFLLGPLTGLAVESIPTADGAVATSRGTCVTAVHAPTDVAVGCDGTTAPVTADVAALDGAADTMALRVTYASSSGLVPVPIASQSVQTGSVITCGSYPGFKGTLTMQNGFVSQNPGSQQNALTGIGSEPTVEYNFGIFSGQSGGGCTTGCQPGTERVASLSAWGFPFEGYSGGPGAPALRTIAEAAALPPLGTGQAYAPRSCSIGATFSCLGAADASFVRRVVPGTSRTVVGACILSSIHPTGPVYDALEDTIDDTAVAVIDAARYVSIDGGAARVVGVGVAQNEFERTVAVENLLNEGAVPDRDYAQPFVLYGYSLTLGGTVDFEVHVPAHAECTCTHGSPTFARLDWFDVRDPRSGNATDATRKRPSGERQRKQTFARYQHAGL